MGIMLASYDIMAVFAVFTVSYFGDLFNRAHCLGYGALIMMVGAAVFAVPHWFGSTYAGYGTDWQQQKFDNLTQINDICNVTGR